MGKYFSLLFSFLLCFINTGSQAASSDCVDDGAVKFLCGPISPEDLLDLPGSPWVVASGMEDDGYLYLTNSEDYTSFAVYPSDTVAHRLDTTTYRDCPGYDMSGFRPHGLSLNVGENGVHTLLVVRHGVRESIEVFEIEETESIPNITWIGCVIAPQDVVFNSVVFTPDGGMAGTHFQLPTGFVYEWHQHSGWEQVPGSEIAGPNGIELSSDGRWFYIAGWGSRSLIKLSRGQSNVIVDSIELPHHIDNIRWSVDGSLLAAGHVGPLPMSVLQCLSQEECDGVSTRVTRVDVNNLTAREIINYPSTPNFILGTVAIEVGNEIWVGGIGGSDRIARFEYR